MTPTLHIHRKDGKWHAAALRAYLDAQPDGQYAVTVKRTTGKKSTQQCAYLHVLFQIVADTLNAEGMGDGSKWTTEKVKEWCKAQGCYPTDDLELTRKWVKKDDEDEYEPVPITVQVVKPTRDLDKEDAMITIDRVMQYWAEFGIVLPSPGEQTQMIP
jgi:hypothetical protein